MKSLKYLSKYRIATPLPFIAVLCLWLFAHDSLAEKPVIKAHSYKFAPLQIEQTGTKRGYAVEIVEKTLKETAKKVDGIDYEILLSPFPRAYAMAQQDPYALFFSIARNPEREDKFQWIGEISPYDVWYFKLKDKDIPQFETIEDLRDSAYTLGIPNRGNSFEYMHEKNFIPNKDYFTYDHYSHGLKMLFRGRFDMMPLTIFVARTNACDLGLNGDAIEPHFHITDLSNPLWLAANKDMPKELVQTITAEFAKLKQQGITNSLTSSYLKEWSMRPCNYQP